jgi:hypothetical protein
MFLRPSRDVVFVRAYSCFSALRRGARAVCLPFCAAMFIVASLPMWSFGAAINYGDLSGTDVNFLMVQEDATTIGDAPPLFGRPTVNEFPLPALPCTTATCTVPGNTLDFTPVGFSASATGTGATGVDITDGNLAFMVMAKAGQAIKNIKIIEQGDTTLSGTVPLNSMLTTTSAKMPTFIDIVAVDGVGITPINLSALSTPAIIPSFSPSGGDFFLGTDGGGGPSFNTTWMGELFVDLEAVLVSRGIPFTQGVTKINVNLDNTLTALSEQGTSATIAKKNFFTVTINIPEPATYGLAFLAALVAVCCRRIRP